MPRPRPGVRLSGEPRARPARGDANAALDLRELVAESLAALADELPASALAAEALYEAAVGMSLALAHGALLETRGDRVD